MSSNRNDHPPNGPLWTYGTHVVLGGAGFLGSHLCRSLADTGGTVLCVDNLITGSLRNIHSLRRLHNFDFIHADVTEVEKYERRNIATVWNLAALASPVAYLSRPLETAWAGAEAHRAALELATRQGARFFFAGTSEVYGDPEVHPQPETYWGNVNPLGLRACYDESKRYGEALAMIFSREYGLDVRLARIFNTYGPNMALDDGRMIPAFIKAASTKSAMPIHGDGSQTRSLCFVSDLIDGLMRFMAAEPDSLPTPPVINLGNPTETTVLEVAHACWAAIHGPDVTPRTVSTAPNPDDPKRRCPDITRAKEFLGWSPEVDLEAGLLKTADYFQRRAPYQT